MITSAWTGGPKNKGNSRGKSVGASRVQKDPFQTVLVIAVLSFVSVLVAFGALNEHYGFIQPQQSSLSKEQVPILASSIILESPFAFFN